MTTKARHCLPACLALSSAVLGAVLLAHEAFHGGVQSHHLLDRPDLPAISNWFGLLVLPLLGWLLGIRLRNQLALPDRSGLPAGVWIGLVCSLMYGGAMAIFFAVGASAWTSDLFVGLFVLSAVLPVYRTECIFGFVLGMTFTFGAILPTLVAVVFAAASAAMRLAFRGGLSAIRRVRRGRAHHGC